MLLIPLEDTRPNSAQAVFDHAVLTFQRGDLAISQLEAEQGYSQFRFSSPDWAAKFLLLQAETMVRRGMYNDALRLLARYQPDSNHPEETIRKLAIEAGALAPQQQFSAANQRLTQAEGLCKIADYTSCGNVLRMRGILAGRKGNSPLHGSIFSKVFSLPVLIRTDGRKLAHSTIWDLPPCRSAVSMRPWTG